jgi:hypothetical protein
VTVAAPEDPAAEFPVPGLDAAEFAAPEQAAHSVSTAAHSAISTHRIEYLRDFITSLLVVFVLGPALGSN